MSMTHSEGNNVYTSSLNFFYSKLNEIVITLFSIIVVMNNFIDASTQGVTQNQNHRR